jgi:hypothetical protein|tara:strand:- start:592 stop:807 length:216 start_codon:yes stop_codon:yes gene_type:complete
MSKLLIGDLVWIPANTVIKYLDGTLYTMGRTKQPTTGVVFGRQSESQCIEHVHILRFEERISVKATDVRKL